MSFDLWLSLVIIAGFITYAYCCLTNKIDKLNEEIRELKREMVKLPKDNSTDSRIGEIVFTYSDGKFWDAGLCLETKNNKPTIIKSKNSGYGDRYFGVVKEDNWVGSGVFVYESEWDKRTNNSMCVYEVANAFGIKLDKIRH